MQRVLVLDKNKKPLMPCHRARARRLLRKGKAAVYRCYPFTIILKEREGGYTQPVALKLDSGSKTTGIVLVGEFERGKRLLWAADSRWVVEAAGNPAFAPSAPHPLPSELLVPSTSRPRMG